MTKLKIDWYPEPIPGFDAIAWKRKVQAEIYEETKHMTSTEVCEYFRKSAEQMRKEREQYWAEQAAENPT
jgi:hypothetical protein